MEGAKLVLVVKNTQDVPMREARTIQLTYIWDGASGISYSRPSTAVASSVKTKDK